MDEIMARVTAAQATGTTLAQVWASHWV